ncbi:MAG: phenylalanine--tRNA ligase subunit beta [Bacteroidetes bacterium]|nr:phenylalanine--tRNA ligase subunit beta [Bacteroidota bacterium]MCL2303247.1 phenylalanine--tRNA ligase subunit beta [Lentimicrobiaceae bacterium]
MKISFNWLKQYINFDLSPEETGNYLTNCGLEVESIEKFEAIKGGLRGIIIGEVLTCEAHPDSDHLHVTTVNIGAETPLNIVCGASNVRAGLKVAVATIGTVLHAGDESFTIKKSKIRGAASEGMICSEKEMHLGDSHEGIMELNEEAQIGQPASEYFKIEADYIFEIGITPNRSDAISHIGVARDLYAALKQNNIPCSKPHLPFIGDFIPSKRKPAIAIIIENKIASPRYTGICLEDVTVKESPEWLKNRLLSVGVRPVNNVVDITQFVMLETGHPLHAFDSDKIEGRKVIIKMLPKDTIFKTLDDKEIKLHEEDLMICDTEKGMCIAGVYGGKDSGITEETKNVFLESAYFNPVFVRKTSKRHGLKTDAAFRFERGCDVNITVYAVQRATQLLVELANAIVASEVIDEYPTVIEPLTISLSVDEVAKLTGQSIDMQVISTILLNLGFENTSIGESKLSVIIPPNKHDVIRPIDLIEEVLRIYGYNNIEMPDEIRYFQHSKPEPTLQKLQKIISIYLADNGFFEMMNNSLSKGEYTSIFDYIDENERVDLVNPLSSELNAMRQTLLFSGLETIARNLNNKNNNLKFFEFGKTYHLVNKETTDVLQRYSEKEKLSLFVTGKTHEENWIEQPKDLDIFFLKNFVENVLRKSGVEAWHAIPLQNENTITFIDVLSYINNEQPIAKIAQIHPKTLKYFDIKKPVYYAEIDIVLLFAEYLKHKTLYTPIAATPAVKRDLALVVDKNVTYQQLENIATKFGSRFIKRVSLFDVYEGDKLPEGKKQYALNFVLQHPEKTMTDEEINKIMDKLVSAFERECSATLR